MPHLSHYLLSIFQLSRACFSCFLGGIQKCLGKQAQHLLCFSKKNPYTKPKTTHVMSGIIARWQLRFTLTVPSSVNKAILLLYLLLVVKCGQRWPLLVLPMLEVLASFHWYWTLSKSTNLQPGTVGLFFALNKLFNRRVKKNAAVQHENVLHCLYYLSWKITKINNRWTGLAHRSRTADCR